jgi:hypothetical protein
MLGRLKDFRRIATRCDRLANNFLAAVCLAATVSYWLQARTLGRELTERRPLIDCATLVSENPFPVGTQYCLEIVGRIEGNRTGLDVLCLAPFLQLEIQRTFPLR